MRYLEGRYLRGASGALSELVNQYKVYRSENSNYTCDDFGDFYRSMRRYRMHSLPSNYLRKEERSKLYG